MRKSFAALVVGGWLLASLGSLHRGDPVAGKVPLRAGLSPSDRITVDINQTNLARALVMYSELTGRTQFPSGASISQRLDEFFAGHLSRWHLVKQSPRVASGIEFHRDGIFSVGEVKAHIEELFTANGLVVMADGKKHFRVRNL